MEVPEAKEITEGPYAGGLSYDFEIRPEALWDNGSPITAYDYLFTIKTINNPKVSCPGLRPYFDFLKQIDINPKNPKKFTVYTSSTYIRSIDFVAYYVYPEYVYDPEQLMRNYSLKELKEKEEVLRSDPVIIEFAEKFNSAFHSRESEGISGSGPYSFKEWKTGQYISLEKKEGWWGENIDSKHFNNGPDRIIHTIINDWSTAISALKDEEIDLARDIRAKDFVDLTNNDRVKQLYELHTPDAMKYDFIAMHIRNPKFSDKRVRKAFNHLIDRPLINETVMYGYGIPQYSPIHPSKSYYNSDIEPYEFDIARAKELLKQAGWEDTDGDGIVDKVIEGKRTPFTVNLSYNQGNTRRENISLIFKENAKKAGIEINVNVLEVTIMLQQLRAHEYEMVVLGLATSVVLDDFKQSWHSAGYNGGSNFTGFGDAYTDELIDKIRVNMDPVSRTAQYKEFQAILNEEVPVIFLLSQKNKLAFHKRFDNANAYVPIPGYDASEWQLKNL